MSSIRRPGATRRCALLVLAAAALVAGCATPPAPETGERLAGRLAIRIDGEPPRSLAAGFELSGSPTRGLLVLSGPLGATAAEARWAPGEAALITGEGRSDYPDLDTLAVQVLGEHVPIAALCDWLRARPWPGAAAAPRRDGVAGFEQMGWQVGLGRWSEGWVEAHRAAPPAVSVRVRLEAAP